MIFLFILQLTTLIVSRSCLGPKFTIILINNWSFSRIMHSSGKEMNRDEMSEMARRIFSSDKLSYQNTRCIYENDDLLVRHQIMTFGDDTKEAVMVVDMKKDGKIFRTETGATSLK